MNDEISIKEFPDLNFEKKIFFELLKVLLWPQTNTEKSIPSKFSERIVDESLIEFLIYPITTCNNTTKNRQRNSWRKPERFLLESQGVRGRTLRVKYKEFFCAPVVFHFSEIPIC